MAQIEGSDTARNWERIPKLQKEVYVKVKAYNSDPGKWYSQQSKNPHKLPQKTLFSGSHGHHDGEIYGQVMHWAVISSSFGVYKHGWSVIVKQPMNTVWCGDLE